MTLIVVVHGVGQQVEGELTVFASYGEMFRPAAEVLSPLPYYDAESVEEGYESELLLALWRRAALVDPHVVPPDEEVLGRSPIWASQALAALSRSPYFARGRGQAFDRQPEAAALVFHRSRTEDENPTDRRYGDIA